MFSPTIKKQKKVLKSLNLKQDLFCRIYANDPLFMGNASQAYAKAFHLSNIDSAKVGALRLLDKPEITGKINEYLSSEGFNNENMDKQLLYVANQHRDLHAKIKGIQEYNKLKKRVNNVIEIIAPKPLTELDDDQVSKTCLTMAQQSHKMFKYI